LTTALKIQLQGNYAVTVVSEIVPGDPSSIKYTSRWAGAHHIYNSFEDAKFHDLEKTTFDIMWDMSKPGSDAEECFLRNPHKLYHRDATADVHMFEKMPNFRRLPKSELIPNTVLGVSFTTVSIDVPIYLNYLLTRFLGNGGRVLRGSVQHINQIIEGGTSLFSGGDVNDHPPDAVIVAVGLGARFLGGVEDKAMYPVRGQTVLVRAPWVRFGKTEITESGLLTYIIPRRSGDVIVGGTRVADDWYPMPRPEITQDILERGFALCPELASPDIRVERKPTIDDVLPHIISVGCGFRPARKGGIRLEVEWTEGVGGRGRVPVIHNYGHDGYGYQTSLGCAIKVAELLEQALATA
jgi:D-aspartate oxidase/D-amino-acid oxidase